MEYSPVTKVCIKGLARFLNKEDGAVTVDWVVLTAAVVGLGVAVLSTVSGGATDLAGDINTTVGDMAVMDH